MITHNRARYTRLAMERLFETCDSSVRVWIWHNGSCQQTLDVVKQFYDHPNLHKFHHSHENQRLTVPTNWLWRNATGTYVSKVDDDSLVPFGWIDTLKAVHREGSRLGAVGCWRFFPEDFIEAAEKKVRQFGGHQVMCHPWMEGSGYLMKRRCVEHLGFLGEDETFPAYCIRLAWLGWQHGWYYPFLYQDHMDDPRSDHFTFKSDSDFIANRPLTALRNGINTLEEWSKLFASTAAHVQNTPVRPGRFFFPRSVIMRMSHQFQKIGRRRY